MASATGVVSDPLDQPSSSRKWTLDENASFRGGAFHLRGVRYCWAHEFRNGKAEMDTEHISGTLTRGYGMCFRFKRRGDARDASGYVLLIAANGQWKLARRDPGKGLTDLTQWRTSKALMTGPGARNTLSVVCHGSLMAAFANGQMLGETQDLKYTDAGGVGPVCGSDEAEIAFRNLKIDPNF